MANSSTLIQKIPCSFSPAGFSQVYQYKVVFDTLTSNLTVHAASSATQRVALLGCIYSEADAHSLSWKSGTTTLVTLQKTTFSGANDALGLTGPTVVTVAGENLVAENLTSAIATMIVYVAEIGPEGLQFQSP